MLFYNTQWRQNKIKSQQISSSDVDNILDMFRKYQIVPSCSAPRYLCIDPSNSEDDLQLKHPDTEAYARTATHDDWDPLPVGPVCPGGDHQNHAPGGTQGSKPLRTGPHCSPEPHHAGGGD